MAGVVVVGAKGIGDQGVEIVRMGGSNIEGREGVARAHVGGSMNNG